MTRPVARILGAGARAPVGMSCLQVAMGVRARLLAPESTAFIDKRGQSVGLCRAGGVGDGVFGHDRLLALGAPALREAAGAVTGALPLMLALPEADRPDDEPRLSSEIVPALAALAGVPVDAGRSRVFREGHAGGAFALEAAAALLSEGVEAVLVGGIDSYLHPEVIAWLDAEYRLHAPGAENGILPSEGAAFLLLARPAKGREGAPGVAGAPAHLVAVRTAREDTVYSDAPNVAAAMTRIVHDLTAEAPIEWALTDVNGERHRIREWFQVELRARFVDGARVQRPADDLGDIGAASGPMFAALACAFWSAGCAPASRALVALCSEGTGRGAFLLEAGAS